MKAIGPSDTHSALEERESVTEAILLAFRTQGDCISCG